MTSNQTWLITGAGRGMGADFANAALAAGHNVVATGRDPDTVARAFGASDDLLVVKLDVTSTTDAAAAVAAGVDLVATTLCGYTAETAGRELPALDLVRELAGLRRFLLCEGGVRSPAEVRAALDAGADAVVVGSAITNVDWLVREFAGAANRVS